ncbi:MAG: OmpA family protein [Hyphomicrobium sp.]|jgi:outer membrane protein OmpA-like peptidoglycan-associated protein
MRAVLSGLVLAASLALATSTLAEPPRDPDAPPGSPGASDGNAPQDEKGKKNSKRDEKQRTPRGAGSTTGQGENKSSNGPPAGEGGTKAQGDAGKGTPPGTNRGPFIDRQARDRANAEAAKKQAADRARFEAEAQQRANQKLEAEKKKAEAQKAQQDLDRAKADAASKQNAERAKAEAQKAQQDLDRAKTDAANRQNAERAKAEAQKTQQDFDRAKTDAASRQNAERAKAEAQKTQQDFDRAKTDAISKQNAERAKAEAQKTQQDLDRAKAGNAASGTNLEVGTKPTGFGSNGGSGRGEQRHGNRAARTVIPPDETKAKEIIRAERTKADSDFEKAKENARALSSQGRPDASRIDERATSKFEDVRKKRHDRIVDGGIALIEEPDKRVIVRDRDRAYIRHDEGDRLRRNARELRHERRPDGITVSVVLGFGGIEIVSEEDDSGRLLRRLRRDRQGREFVLVDNRDFYRRRQNHGGRFFEAFIDLPPPRLRIPHEKYVVDYDRASDEDIYEALAAPPVERLERSYSLEEVRQSYPLRERMRRIDLDAINFAFASWDVDPEQYPKLERVAEAIKRIIDRNPDEMFMIEGHTDLVGSEIDNLSLSDRRAESVAIILSDTFRVPPENLTTQGYGEQFPKVDVDGPSRENRRVAIRRITPLLSRDERHSGE